MPDRRAKKDRRAEGDRRRRRSQRGTSARVAVVELARRHLRIVILDRKTEDSSECAFAKTLLWNHDSFSLQSEEGLAALVKSLKQIATEWGLHGASLRIVLSGEFCITRTFRGASEVVRHEVQQLQQRCQLYLSLGPGEKIVVSNSQWTDARHVHTLAAVCNAKSLNTIHQAAASAGMKVESIEPALVSVCSAVHRLEDEPEEPYFILYLDGSTAEIGICQRGLLLLDYRPDGRTKAPDPFQLICQHRARLQRHAGRQLDGPTPTIRVVYLCGDAAAVDACQQEFAADKSFQPTIIDPHAIRTTWTFAEGLENSEVVPALGAMFSATLAPKDRNAPNFMEHIRSVAREPLRPTLFRSFIPLAAMLLVGLTIFLLNLRQQSKLSGLRSQLSSLAPVQARANALHRKAVQAEVRLQQLNILAAQLSMEPASHVIQKLGHCLPVDVWLQRLEIDDMKSARISGASLLEAGVYDFVHYLEQAPYWHEVALSETQPGISRAGSTVSFHLELNLGGDRSAGQDRRQ